MKIDGFVDIEGLGPQQQALLELRAARLQLEQRAGAREDADIDDAQLVLAVFPVGADSFALPLVQVRAAVPLRVVTPVPLAPAHVIGVLRFRGALVTVVSLASLLGVTGWKIDPAVLLLVEAQPGSDHLLAVDCEQIPRAVTVPAAVVDVAQSLSSGPTTKIILHDRSTLTVIEDLDELLRRRLRGGVDAH